MINRTLSFIAFTAVVLLGSCASPTHPQKGTEPITQIANPASVYCAEVGGRSLNEKRPDGAAFGVCLFEDNRQCGEWALFRKECPVGGVRITGYLTDAARFCAITGGEYALLAAATETKPEQGTCTILPGKECDVHAYYRGRCR